MPSSLAALGVLILAVLPGLLYVWGFEREAGRWSIGPSDRVLRFLAVSCLFLAVFSLPLVHFLAAVEEVRREQPTLSEALLRLPGWVAGLPLLYVATPLAAGTLAGVSVRRRRAGGVWAMTSRILAGPEPAPTAWDELLLPRPSGLIRLRLTDGRWVGGLFAGQSYASGSTDRPQDLLLEVAVEVGEDGSFALDREGRPVPVGSALLLMRDTVQHLEFFDREDGNGPQAKP